MHFDGACDPPKGGGVATWGYTLEGSGLAHEDCGLAVRPHSAHATNNVAEYVGAIRALEWLVDRGFHGSVAVVGDSELVIRQMNGEYRVRAEHLRAYYDRLGQLGRTFASVRFEWVPRERNERADELSKLALEDAKSDADRHRPERPVEVADEDPGGPEGA